MPPRWSARLPVQYQIFDARAGQLELSRLRAAAARDLGPNGMFLQQVALPIGTRLHFFLRLPDASRGWIEAFGRIVHGRPRLDALGHEVAGVGVSWSWMTGADRARLDAYLAERQTIDAACLSAARVRQRAEHALARRTAT